MTYQFFLGENIGENKKNLIGNNNQTHPELIIYRNRLFRRDNEHIRHFIIKLALLVIIFMYFSSYLRSRFVAALLQTLIFV